MIEVEVFGAALLRGGPTAPELRELCVLAARSAGVRDGHLAVQFVDAERIARLNEEHRGRPEPTDVLSFPIDGAQAVSATPVGRGEVPRELGDVLICPEYTRDVREAVVHGVLHLAGLDHETDRGEMLALQRRLLRRDHS